MMNARVSVVVPTYKRARLLHRCLNALVAQDLSPELYEIIVVDDARSDETGAFVAAFARNYEGRPAVRYLRPPEGTRGPAAARNAGWKAAQSELIAFTDDDTIPAHNWLSEGLRAMRGEVSAAWGDVMVPLPERPTDAERNTAGLDGAEFVTANCFVRREAIAAVGGFDEQFQRAWREDSDLYFTLLERGLRVISAPAAIVIHPARTAPPGTCVKQHRNLFFDALLYKKHPRLYREKIASSPPLLYYTIVALALLCGAAMIAGFPTVAAGAAAGWAALTAALAVRRLIGLTTVWREVADILTTSLVIPFVAVYWRLAGALHFRVLFA